MKKHFYAASLLLFGVVAVSCNRNAEVENPEDESAQSCEPIRISTIGLSSEPTKLFTGEATLSTLQESGFRCYAFLGADKLEYIDDKVEYDGTSFSFTNGDYYYPAKGTLDFYAVYPKSMAVYKENCDENYDGLIFVDFSNTGKDDVLLATATGKAAKDGEVVFEFNHLLTVVTTRIKGADPNVDYKLRYLILDTPYAARYFPEIEQWEYMCESRQEEYANYDNQVMISNTYTEIGYPVACIPDVAYYYIGWDCLDKKTGSVVGSYTSECRLDSYLKSGYRTTFNLSLPNSKAAEVGLSVSVEPWETETQELDMIEFLK